MNVFEYFKKKGIDVIDRAFYTKIDLWDSWYRSNVQRFHRYRVYRGSGSYIRCQRKSLGMAKKICEDMADLLLNERVRITVADETTSDYVQRVLHEANFDSMGNEYQERKAACGTVAYVPYLTNMEIDEEGNILHADVKLDYVTARNIYPTAWENGRITEVIFAFPKVWQRKKYINFQHHKLEQTMDESTGAVTWQYVILNYVAEESAGRDLTPEEWNRIPYFTGLAARVETGSDKPQFTIDKLAIANNVDEDDSNPMGISIFANSLDVLAKLDLEYDSYANEFTLGRKRIFVAPEMLTASDGSMVFDPDDSVFYMLPEDYFRNTNEALHEVNMSLRVAEHEQAINNDLNLLSMKLGFGTQYYKFDRGTVATATQVISENSDMYRTIQKHELILSDVLTDLIRTIIRLGIAAGESGLVADTEITIMFDDSIIEDKATERNEDRKDVAMGVMGLAEYRSKWYGETEDAAAKRLPDQSDGVLM